MLIWILSTLCLNPELNLIVFVWSLMSRLIFHMLFNYHMCYDSYDSSSNNKDMFHLLLVLRDRPIKSTACNSHTTPETINIFRLITQIASRSSLTRIQHYASADNSG